MSRFDSSGCSIDGRFVNFVKGIAILLIFGHHWARTILEVSGRDRPTLMQWHFVESASDYNLFCRAIQQFDILTVVQQGLGHWGYVGVNLFVVVSGFGLAYQGVRREQNWIQFIGRRLRKLLPAFYCIVVVFAILQYITGIHNTLAETLEAILVKASFLFFVDARLFFNDNSPLWFFGLIIPLYFCFPLLYRGAVSDDRWYLIFWSLVFGSVVKYFVQQPTVTHWHPFLSHGLFLARIPEFFLGIILGYLCRRKKRFPFTRFQLLTAALFALAVVFAAHSQELIYLLLDPSLAVFSVFVSIIVYQLAEARDSPLFRFVCWLGVISFCVFLIHRPIITILYQYHIFQATSGLTVLVEFLCLLSGVLFAAHCMNYIFKYLRVIPST